MDRYEHEHYQRRIDGLEHQNKQLLNQLMKYDIVTPRVIHIDNVSKDSIDRSLQQENTQLKSDLQALRELLKNIEIVVSHASYEEFCPECNENPDSGKIVHKEGCWLKAELDKIKVVE